MAYYHPCRGCALAGDPCSRRDEIKAALAGLSITSVKFKCTKRTPHFHTGDRVSFLWRVFGDPDPYGDTTSTVATFHGTIVKEATSTKFTLVADEGLCVEIGDDWDRVTAAQTFNNKRRVINVKASDITAIDEPRRSICLSCLGMEGDEACHGYTGRDKWDSYWPTECLRKPPS